MHLKYEGLEEKLGIQDPSCKHKEDNGHSLWAQAGCATWFWQGLVCRVLLRSWMVFDHPVLKMLTSGRVCRTCTGFKTLVDDPTYECPCYRNESSVWPFLEVWVAVSLFEAVDLFCYLGEISSDVSGCDAAAMANWKCAWGKFDEHLPRLTAQPIHIKTRGVYIPLLFGSLCCILLKLGPWTKSHPATASK